MIQYYTIFYTFEPKCRLLEGGVSPFLGSSLPRLMFGLSAPKSSPDLISLKNIWGIRLLLLIHFKPRACRYLTQHLPLATFSERFVAKLGAPVILFHRWPRGGLTLNRSVRSRRHTWPRLPTQVDTLRIPHKGGKSPTPFLAHGMFWCRCHRVGVGRCFVGTCGCIVINSVNKSRKG